MDIASIGAAVALSKGAAATAIEEALKPVAGTIVPVTDSRISYQSISIKKYPALGFAVMDVEIQVGSGSSLPSDTIRIGDTSDAIPPHAITVGIPNATPGGGTMGLTVRSNGRLVVFAVGSAGAGTYSSTFIYPLV